MTLFEKCWKCDGDGKGDDSDEVCTNCNGKGSELTEEGFELHEFIRCWVIPMIRKELARAKEQQQPKQEVK